MKGGGQRQGTTRLFGTGELRLRRSWQGHLKELSQIPPRRPTRDESAAHEERNVIERLRAWGADLSNEFGLGLPRIDAEAPGVVAHYGICFSDGTIRIRLRHATTGRLLKESSLVDTLCHELAHLRHFDHSPRFRSFYLRILEKARWRGYYRPGPSEAAGPSQPFLFDEMCGTVPSGRAAARTKQRKE